MTAPRPVFAYAATVVTVTDGDTLRLDIDLGFHVGLSRQAVRVVGPDRRAFAAPELRQLGGLEARAFLVRLVPPGAAVTVRTYRPEPTDKYGRWLAEVWPAGAEADIASQAVAAGVATWRDG